MDAGADQDVGKDDDDWDISDRDEIDDPAWDFIQRCCTPRPEDRPRCSDIRKLIVAMNICDTQLEAKEFLDTEILKLRSNSEIDQDRLEKALSMIQVNQMIFIRARA
jgi:hypothetical protein